MSRRPLIALLLVALTAACADNPPTAPCGGAMPTGDPPTPVIGDFPKVTSRSTGFPIAGWRAPGSAVRVGAGHTVAASCDRYWSTTIDLPDEGANTFTVFAESTTLNISPSTTLVIVRDTVPPAAPAVDTVPPATASTAAGVVTVSGSREAGAVVRLNGLPLVPAGSATAFTAQVALPLGGGAVNTLSFTQVDAAGNTSSATVLSITRTSAPGTAPRLNFPLDRQRLAVPPSFPQMLLIWNQAGALATYHAQVAASPAFDPVVVDADTAGLSLPVTLADGTWYWRVAVLDGGGNASYGQTRAFTLGAQPGDVDGDGYSDLIAGNPGQDNGGQISDNPGGVKLFPGGADLQAASPVAAALTVSGPEARAELGIAVAGGDLNGDGFADMAAGAHRADPNGNGSGSVHVLHGGATPNATIDLTLDGQNADDQFGLDLASGFDLNADGIDDLAVSAWQYDQQGTDLADNRGRVYVFLGGLGGMDGVPDLILTGAAERDNFGSGLTGGFDLNGDGFDDLAVGAPLADAPGPVTNAGAVSIFHGGPAVDGVADLTLHGLAAEEHLGSALSGTGDLNGGGFDWLAAGAPAYGSGGTVGIGRVHLFQGGTAPDATADLIIPGATECEAFGFSLAGGGDLNGDGLADLAVGVPFSNVGASDPTCASQAGDQGMVEIHLGAPVPDTAWDARFTGAFANDRLGMGLHRVADANGDGLHDLVAGAPNNDEGSTVFGDSGRAYVLFGPGAVGWSGQQPVTGAGGAMTVPGAILASDGDKDGMGTSVW